jgi:DNA-binding CsgD family transcriptional regulator
MSAIMSQPSSTQRIGSSQLADLLAASMNEIDCGMLVCDELGRVFALNYVARQELAQAGPLQSVNGCLQAESPADKRALAEALREAATADRRKLLSLGKKSATRLFISVMPMPAASREPLALVMLGRRQACPQLALELLASQFELTMSERRVLNSLLAGLPPSAVARSHGVATSTVRSHIAAIRAKIGVRSIEELFRVVARLPPITSALRCAARAPSTAS